MSGFKINLNELSEEERVKVENATRDSFLQKIHDIFYEYSQVDEAYKYGFLTPTQKANCQSDIFDKSGYEDVYDFLYDYNRWKIGLPIYIKFKLI